MAGLTGRSLRDKSLVETVISSITGLKGLAVEPLKTEDFTKAIDLMQRYDLDYEDSLHLNVAMRTGIKKIISNDKDFDKTPLKRLI